MLAINATFIGQLLVLLVLLWFIYKFVVPMLAGPIEERQRKIAQGLAAADQGQVEKFGPAQLEALLAVPLACSTMSLARFCA